MDIQLAERDREILRILIADYIATADPVGSRTIAKKYHGHLSAATIRNVMSDLTEMGLLAQPHTSAGRIPTGAAFRYYVDSLLKRRELSDAEMEAIRERCEGDERSVGAVLARTSRMLAAVSHYVGIVATPRAERTAFKQIEFVPLSRRRILGILVSQDGSVENRLIEVGEDLTYPELERISNYCNHAFFGLTLDEAREKVRRELETERADYDRLIKKAMVFSGEVLESVHRGDLVVDGEVQLLDAPEFAETEKFKRIVEALEEKQKVLHMLERCSEGEGVKIFLGADAEVGGVDLVGVVSAPYFKEGRMVGTLGVIGPMRMDYSRVVPIVDFTAKVLGDVLEK
ncbi:MAG TPA: heat-inducible transcriptional repressor HrcA [bacterium]|nr:heat-inducible transcriptional repressor HrcA [bacterium]